jgi:hypothetical protein
MGAAARRQVIDECGWDRVLAPLRALLEGAPECPAHESLGDAA